MLLKINNRQYFIDADHIDVTPVSAGRYEVSYHGRTFTVVGGRASGGGEREWFCHHPEFYGDVWLPTNSMIAAIRMGVQF
jgi:hypothetical protein